MNKKCDPLKCYTFSNMAKKLEHKMLVDKIVVMCPFRQHNLCYNNSEELKEVLY